MQALCRARRFWWPTDRSEPCSGSRWLCHAAPVDSDWQMFREGDGIGNFGLNAQNGGDAFGTSSSCRAQDRRIVPRDLRNTEWKKKTPLHFRPSSPSSRTRATCTARCSLLADVPEAERQRWHARRRFPRVVFCGSHCYRAELWSSCTRRMRVAFGQHTEQDTANTTSFNGYPNAEMALPENTAWIGDFARSGTLMVHGQTFLVDRKPVTIALDDATGTSLPSGGSSIAVLGLNAFGVRVDLNCTIGLLYLSCGGGLR